MRILHTIYDDPKNPWLGGGGAFRTFEICKRLAEHHDVTVLCGSYPGVQVEEERDGLRVIHVGSSHTYSMSRLSYSLQASRFVARTSPDLWVYSFSAFAPVLATESTRKDSILECFHLMQRHASEKHAMLGRIAAATEKATLKAYDDVISISPSVLDEMARLRGSDRGLHLVYTGVDASCFIDDPSEEDYILYFGRLDTYTKGLDLLFEAFARIGKEAAEIRLIVAGRGTPKRLEELKELSDRQGISDRVTFTGPVDTDTKISLFRGSLFNVAPSRYEGWCISAIEASAAGKAVVGTRIPGLQDAVKHGETGLLAAAENVHEIADGMRRLLSNPELRDKLGRQGRQWAEQFTWNNITAAQENAYRKILEGRNSQNRN